jgi:drug/metabolite transporter (DMT)-like permease
VKLSPERLGVIIALTAAACFALANSITVVAYRGGSNPLTVTGTRFILPTLLLIIILRAGGISLILPRATGLAALALGVLTAFYSFSLLMAIDRLGVPVAILVFYLFPILTGLIVALFGWGRLSVSAMISAVVCFAGLALVLGVGQESLPTDGLWLALFAAVGLAIVTAVSGRVIKGCDPRQATLYMAAGALLSMIVIGLVVGGFRLPETEAGWIGFGATHLFYAGAMISYFAAIARIGAARTSLFSFLEPVVAISVAFLLLDQVLTPLQILGAFVILGALVAVGRAKVAEPN